MNTATAETVARATYAQELAETPRYHDGAPRPAWDRLSAIARANRILLASRDALDAQETQWADSVARLTRAASTGPVLRRNLAVSALAYADRLRTEGRIAEGLAQMSRVLTLTGA